MIPATTMFRWLNTRTRTGERVVGHGRGDSTRPARRPDAGHEEVSRRVRVCAILLVCLIAAGCSDAPRDVLRFGLADAPAMLDPRFATDAASARVNRLLYRRLADVDDGGMPVPALAEWQRLSSTHYRFVLRQADREFHDGSRLTARDVKATYDYVLDPANASPHRAMLAPIRNVEAIDEDTVDFHLQRPDPLFPAYLVIGILPAQRIAAKHDFQRQPIGSGPVSLLGRPDDSRLRLLRRRDGQVIEFVRVPDPTMRALKLIRGELDMVQNDLPPEILRYLANRQGLYVQQGRGANFAYLGFNLSDPITGRLEVRKAIAHAIDRDGIIRHVLAGAARPADALLPPDHWAGGKDLRGYEYAPEKARALLAQAGYDQGHPAHIIYKTSSDPFRVRLATIVQDQLGKVGIRVELRSFDWGTFYGDIRAGRFQMYGLSWVGIRMPDIFRYAFHSTSVPPSGANRGAFRSVLADRLIERAEATESLEEQGGYYRTLQERLLEELPYVPLWYEDHVFVARQDIEGYTLATDGNYDGLMGVHRKAVRTASR